MAESKIPIIQSVYNQGVLDSDITFAAGSIVQCQRYGKIVVVSYYLVPTQAVSRLTTLATLDVPTNFIGGNIFDGVAVRLEQDTKLLKANINFVANQSIAGQVVGVIY
jgi:hypothetical protein